MGLVWQKLVKKAGVTSLSFKYLRKTGADMIRKIGGRDVSEVYLAHSEPALSQAYTNRDFDKLSASLHALQQQLARAFE